MMLKSLLPPARPASSSRTFVIGDWIVSPSRNMIRRRGEKAGRSVEPLLIRFLDVLARNAGDTVTKDELVDKVWDGVIASDEAMAQAASRLRKVLGDDPRQPKYVETVRKLGYRLALPAEDWAEFGRWRRTAALIAGLASIAVLLAWLVVPGRSAPSYDLTPVATDARDERKPAVSPDGRQIAYEVVGPDGTTSIWVGNGKSGGAAKVSGTDGAEAPVWLSNRSLAMEVRRGAECRLVATDLGYLGRRIIGRCDGSGYADLAVSPDGRRLAFNAFGADPAGPRAIHVVEIGGAGRRVSAPPTGSWGDYNPEFSPNGKSLLFTRAASEGQQDLFLLGQDSRERRLTRRFGNIFGATWADSGTIIYSARSGGRFALRTLNLASGKDLPLPLAISDAVDPLAKNQTLFVESRRFHSQLVSSRSRSLPNSSGLNLHPALSPDGQRIVFTSDRSGALELWLFDREAGQLSQLTRYGGPFVGVPRFAPNGQTLAYEVRTGDDSDIYVLDLRTRRSRPLLKGKAFDTAPSISAGGRWVLFGSDREGGWNLYRVLLTGGAPQRILADAFAAIESPDGKAVYFTRRSRPGLFRLDRASRHVSTVETLFAPEDWGAFAPVHGGVIFVRRLGPRQVRIEFRTDEGALRVLTHPLAPVPSHDPVLAARPDRAEFIYAQSDDGSGDIYRAHPGSL